MAFDGASPRPSCPTKAWEVRHSSASRIAPGLTFPIRVSDPLNPYTLGAPFRLG